MDSSGRSEGQTQFFERSEKNAGPSDQRAATQPDLNKVKGSPKK